jgi:phage terminase large subunit-like protein
VALCKRCGEEIALANDLDRSGDIDPRRHRVMVAGKPPRRIGKSSCCSTAIAGDRL